MTKVTRIALMALVLAALLAVASFAGYSINLDGTVSGLEDGVEYTAAKYDFAADAYGEFAELTETTALTPGVWGIKAGDADAETVFVSGSGNGEITFWNTETNLPVYNMAGVNDNLVPGKWSVSSNSAFRTVQVYNGAKEASACLYLTKEKYLEQVVSTTQKTVTVEEVAYPVYTIDGAEYYLKEGAYYAVADGALYEGEGEAAAVYPLTWKNATPIEGEANLLQESVAKYGFAANQIVPAKDVNAITNAWLTIQTGGNALNTGYTSADIKGTFTFIVKVPGAEGYEEYVVDIDASTVDRKIAAPAAMADSEGYLVGFEFAPYANCPDDIFKGSSDTANECYAHYGLYKGLNVIDFDEYLPAAPTGVIDGFGTFGGLDNGDYMVSSVTINAAGDGFTYGGWEEFDPDSRAYVGLYAIKEVYGDRETAETFAYSYGVHEDRAAIGAVLGTGEKPNTVLVTGGQKFTPGQYGGNYTSYWTGTAWEIMSHGQIDAGIMSASQNAQAAYDALVADETATEDDIAAAKATLDAKNTTLINALNKVVLKYAYAADEIIPTSLVNSFRITANQNNGAFTLVGNQDKKAVAYVADNEGNITKYEQTITQPFNKSLDFTVDFASFLPEEGYLIAFDIYPCTNVTLDTFGKVTSPYAFRYYTKVLPSNYSIDRPEALPSAGDKPEGLTIDREGIISGLDATKRYQYTQFDIGGMLPEVWNVVPAGETTIDVGDMCGLIAVRYMGDGYTNDGSEYVALYRPGNSRNDILHLKTVNDKNGNEIQVPEIVASTGGWSGRETTNFNEGKWTGMALTNSLAVNHGFNALILGTTDTPSGTAGVSEFQKGTYTSLDVVRKALKGIYYTYQYLPEEIVEMKFFESFTYTVKMRQSAFRVTSGKIYTQFTLWVVTEDGELEARTVNKQAVLDYGGNTQTVTLADFAETDGYIVAIEIRPYAEGSDDLVLNIPESQKATNGDYTVTLFEDGYKVVITLPETDKPVGISLEDGKVVGLDANESYKYAQFNISGIAENAYVDVEDGATEFEIGDMVGLIAISKKGDGIYEQDSAPVYVYVPAGGYDNILHTHDVEATGGPNAGKVIAVPDVVKASDDGKIHFNAGKWTGIGLENGLQTGYNFDPLILGSTGCYVGNGKALKAAEDAFAALGEDATADEIAAATAALETAREEAAARSGRQYFSYAYLPNEIIPMRDFISYTYGGPRVRQYGFLPATDSNVYTKFVFKVITEDGELVDREVLKKVAFPWNNTTTIYASDFTETDGYIVGIVIYPFGHIDGYYKANGDGTTSGDYNIQLYADGYKATRTLAPAKMTKLEMENGVVSGFDAEYTYEYAAYGINGAIGDWTVIEGDEFALANTGLTAIRIKTDNANYGASAPQIFYLAGSYVDRNTIMETNEDGTAVGAKTSDFVIGTLTATNYSYLNASSVGTNYAGANAILDQQVGNYGNVGAAEKLWLLQHTKEEAQAILNAEANHQSAYNQTEGHDGSYYPARLQGVIDAHYAQAHDIPAETKAITDNLVNNYSKSYIRYAYTADEIVPVGELGTVKFLNKTRQGAFEFKAKSRVNFYVMDENGVVTPYAWTSNEYAVARHTNYYHTIDVQKEVDLPESGWIVGIEFIPYAVVDGSSVVSVANARIAYKAQAWAFDQQHVNMGFYFDGYEVIKPKVEKPDYIEYADGTFTGLLTDKTYAYGRFTADGVEEVTEVTGVTELDLPDVGVWGIQLVPEDRAELDNSDFIVGYNKDMTNARDSILHLVDYEKSNGTVVQVPVVESAGTFSTINPVVFNEGTWTGYSLNNALVNHGYTSLVLGTTSCTVPGSYANAIKTATNDVALEAARKSAANAIASVYYSYEYTAAEAIPMNEFISWTFKSAERQGSLQVLEGSLQTKFVFKVVTDEGIIEDRVVYKNVVMNGGGSDITVSIDDFAETDGYIVGIVIYPYGNCPEGTVIGSDNDTYNNTPIAEDIIVILQDTYTVVPAESGKPAETPVLSLTVNNAVVKVTNYNAAADYAYSTDGGETWVVFEGDSFYATKANTQYVVKALESTFFGESEVSEAVTSPAITMVGRSLVLDGQIGLKIYFDIATDLIKTDSVVYYTTKVNNDYKNYPSTSEEFTALYRKGNHVSMTRSHEWMTNFRLDEETGLYYVIVYVPAKDIDNTSFESQLDVTLLDGTKVTVNTLGMRFTTYIEEAKNLAAAGDEAFVAALPLVEALETYLAYADNYFGEGEDAAYVSTASMEEIAAPSRTNAALEGVAFYGTSLILEDQVTIRHYFAVEDLAAFEAAYDVAGKYGVKGNFIYFDITDIPAQEIGEVKTLAIADLEGNTVYEVNYSVANYIKDMVNDEDVNLASLVNAMYDYYLKAAAYNAK